MAEKLTPEQQQAVADRGGKLLVAAAAGSGKTKVLVDRLLSYLTDPIDPANIDSFLIITYTKAAAAELRGKIAAKLSEKIAESPEDRHLQQQLQRLYLTKISTVHAFCSEILREYAYRLDIPGDFRVADEMECQDLQMRAIDRVLEAAYVTVERNGDFRAFIDTQGLARDDRQIPQILLKVYHSAMCHLSPDMWLDWCEASTQPDEATDAAQTVWGKYLLEDLRRFTDLNIAALNRCLYRARETEAMEKPAALLESTVAQLTRLRDSETWDDVTARKNIDFGRLVFSKKCTDPILSEQIKAVRGACKKGLEKRLRSFSDESAQVLQDLWSSGAAVRGLISTVRQFADEYDRIKKSRRVLDFGDLEHRTLDLLLGKKRTGPTSIALEIGERFREIMVDEYQDSNGVQDAIFSVLTQKRQNCFMVGDVKQSIYQFRLADPGIFIEKYNAYAPADIAAAGQGRKVLLSSNFRSSSDVISAVNDVFTTCMSADVGGLDYGEAEMLREGIPHIPLNEPGVELYGIQVQEDTYAEEAAFTATRIARLLDGKHYVRSGDSLRPIKPDDIVILLRSPSSVGGEFRYALEQFGIRCATDGNCDLLQTEEVSTLRALLQIINNPLQDIPLTAVLMSRIFGFTADDMARLRGVDRRCNMYTLLRNCDKGKSFCKLLEQLRKEAGMLHLTQLVERVLLLTRMDTVFSAMPDGKERRENLQAFCQIVSEYDSGGRGSLVQFMEYLDTVEERGLHSPSEQQQAGCVTIMSIHKSKGLEFPVVFLCGLSRGFNQESAREQVLCDRDLGLGLSCVEPKQRIRYPSIAKRAIAAKIMADSISEEMRVLYVAMTRARDRLIMTYAANNLETELQDLAARIDLSDRSLITGQVDCPGSWVLQTALRRTEAGQLFALAGYPPQARFTEPAWHIQVVDGTTHAGTAETCDLPSDTDLDPEISAKLKADLTFSYDHIAATQTPSKQTATQLKGRVKDQEAAEGTQQARSAVRAFRKPAFAQTLRRGMEYGTAMHAVMQYLRYDACTDPEGIVFELERMVNQNLITPEQAQMVSCQQIAAFFGTDIGKRLINCPNLLREFKFSILDDGEAYVPGMKEEQVLLQGVVDCALIEPDGITVVDFKTDYVTDDTVDQAAENYHAQVMAYAKALERIYHKRVKAAYLYFFRLNCFISVQP